LFRPKRGAIRTEFPLPIDQTGIPNAGHSKPARVYCQATGGRRFYRRNTARGGRNQGLKFFLDQILRGKAAPLSRFFHIGVSIIRMIENLDLRTWI